jgi:hypothetical protein
MLNSSLALAAVSDAEMARHITSLLGSKFQPESLTVTVRESQAYAEMRGAIMGGIRIDTMRLDALLTNREMDLSDDVESLSSLIGYSRGELVLLEKDVNSYFNNNDTKGFSKLTFDFTPKGFSANGLFSADFVFKLRIRLSAAGVLGLSHNGVNLENVEIYVEKMKQPEILTEQIVSRVNPLLEWSDIPFKVEFKTVIMNDDSARMTGYPRTVSGGSSSVWEPPNRSGADEKYSR